MESKCAFNLSAVPVTPDDSRLLVEGLPAGATAWPMGVAGSRSSSAAALQLRARRGSKEFSLVSLHS